MRRSSNATSNVDPTIRLYFAYFLRVPDRSGLNYWIGHKRSGTALQSISNGFAGSNEFKTRYGSLTNRESVNLIYDNVLGRAGDNGGVNYWTSELDSHADTRGQVMVGFSESNEYRTKKLAAVDVAVTWIDMLRTSPDQTSFNTWVTNLTTGGKTLRDLVDFLLPNST